MIKLDVLLREMVDSVASDLFLKAGSPPALRIDGQVTETDYPPLTMDDTRAIAYDLMNEEQRQYFEKMHEMDLAVGIKNVGRFRINVYFQRGTIAVVFRHVRKPDFTFEELNLPQVIRRLSEYQRGLILVTGTAGSGKSTTLAAMINHINNLRSCHIVTVEDPIEFIHQDNLAILSQREIGFDTLSFPDALKRIMRQSPDVMLIGEMRDLETINAAITAAQTGHLVLSTLHTIDAPQTLERIINYYPTYLHQQIRMELALCLISIISLRLLPKVGGGRVPAVEVLINTPTMRKLLADGKTMEVPKFITQGAHFGMQSFNQSLLYLHRRKLISYETALAYSSSPDEFRLMAEGISSGTSSADSSIQG